MKCLIFTQTQYDKLLALQEGQHQLAPVALTDGKYFLMEDILTEMPDGIYKNKIKDISYTLVEFDTITDLMPVNEGIDI
jgi:hypothetical protein